MTRRVPCLKGDFLGHALCVQRAGGAAAITTVRMLERELALHERDCLWCRPIATMRSALDLVRRLLVSRGHDRSCISNDPEDALDALSCDCGLDSALRAVELVRP